MIRVTIVRIHLALLVVVHLLSNIPNTIPIRAKKFHPLIKEQLLIYTGTLRITMKNYDGAIEQIFDSLQQAGGYMLNKMIQTMNGIAQVGLRYGFLRNISLHGLMVLSKFQIASFLKVFQHRTSQKNMWI